MYVFAKRFLLFLLQDNNLFSILFLMCAITCTVLVLRRLQENTGLPPGPFPWPIIGNLHLLGNNPHERLTELAKTFGDVYSLQLGSRRVIVLNSLDCVKETLVKKSSDFSSRPPLSSLQASNMNGRSVAFGPYGPMYLKNRRLAQLVLHSFMLNQDEVFSLTEDCIECLSKRFARHEQEFDPTSDVEHSVAEMNLMTFFGREVDEKQKNELFMLLKTSKLFIKKNSVNNLVDFLPWLSPFFQSSVDALKELVQELVNFVEEIYLKQKKNYTGNTNASCMAAALTRCYEDGTSERLVALGEDLDMNKEKIIALLTDLFGASVETTSATLTWAIYYLAAHPNIQDRVYKEMSEIVGVNYINVNDKHRLPFLEATVLEILRYSTVLPLAIPHYAEHETTVGPYRVPEDTIIFVNLWAVNHDERVFKDAYKFDPGRFIDENGEVNRARFSSIPFSTGTRKCLGHLLAQLQLFLLVGGIVQKYRIELSDCPSLSPEFGFILRPQSFKIRVHKRE